MVNWANTVQVAPPEGDPDAEPTDSCRRHRRRRVRPDTVRAGARLPLPDFCSPPTVVDNVCTVRLASVTADAIDGTITGSPVGGGAAITLTGPLQAYQQSAGFGDVPPAPIQRWDSEIEGVGSLSTDPNDPNWYGNAKSLTFLPRTLNDLATQFPRHPDGPVHRRRRPTGNLPTGVDSADTPLGANRVRTGAGSPAGRFRRRRHPPRPARPTTATAGRRVKPGRRRGKPKRPSPFRPDRRSRGTCRATGRRWSGRRR